MKRYLLGMLTFVVPICIAQLVLGIEPSWQMAVFMFVVLMADTLSDMIVGVK